MNTCPYRNRSCSTSCPCTKCRETAVRKAHTLVRFDSQGRRRNEAPKAGHGTYEGIYWQKRVA